MVATLLSVLSVFHKNVKANKMSDSSSAVDPKSERTFIAVKPDGVQRGLIGEIVKRFEQRGYKMVAAKMTWVRRRVF